MKNSNEKGITLIALVITLILLLILARISISMLTGENGLLSSAQKAKKLSQNTSIEEQISLAFFNLQSEYYTLSTYDTTQTERDFYTKIFLIQNYIF